MCGPGPARSLSKLLWKFPVKGCILMDSIYHQRRILSKRINTLQCKAQRKDQHRKQKRQEIDPPSVSLFFVFFRFLYSYWSHFISSSVCSNSRPFCSGQLNYLSAVIFWNTVISFPSFFWSSVFCKSNICVLLYRLLINLNIFAKQIIACFLLYHVFVKLLRIFFRAKEKSCHILGDTENSADVTASFWRNLCTLIHRSLHGCNY